MSKSEKRGFEMLVGKTIESVDQDSINIVRLITTEGEKFEIDAEARHYGIEILQCVLKAK